MNKFTYKIIDSEQILTQDDFNQDKYGEEGWELITVLYNENEKCYMYYFKKQVFE